MKRIFLLLAVVTNLGLLAQDFRVLADGGGVVPSENRDETGISSRLGLEMLVPVAPETYLTVEASMGYRANRITAPIFDPFTDPRGIIIDGLSIGPRFTEAESYRILSQYLVTGVGIEQHVNRLRAQLSARVGYRFKEQVRFREATVFSGNQPMNIFEASVASGERFDQGVQTQQIDLNKRWRFQLGTSVRYAPTKRLEVGLATYYDLGNYRVERRIVSFCDNCPIDDDVGPERSVKNRGIELLLSTRYQL